MSWICDNRVMSDTKILQAILDGQTGLKKDIQEVRRDITEVKEEVRKTEGRLTARINFTFSFRQALVEKLRTVWHKACILFQRNVIINSCQIPNYFRQY